MDILTAIGKKIRKLRKEQGLSQEKLGELAGLSANYIGFIERGQRQVALDSLQTIAEVLGTDLSCLFERTVKTPLEKEEITALVKAAHKMNHDDLMALVRIAQRLARTKKPKRKYTKNRPA